MTEVAELDNECFRTTDGEIAIANLNSARLRSWNRFYQDPLRTGIAETVVEHEQLMAQFASDFSALDRLESLVEQLIPLDASSPRTGLIQTQVASMLHRFSDARRHLDQASLRGAPSAEVKRLLLNIDQACGANLNTVLDERRQIAGKSRRLEDRVSLGALLADLGEFTDADHTYRQALREYQDVSPFPVAWVCFQLGVLWGELVPEPRTICATQWYERALARLPSYTKARVHLAEIYSSCGRADDAETLLTPALSSDDPEVRWRLADCMAIQGKSANAEAQMRAARSGFESVLERHPLAFADHAAEFYAGSGNDCRRALELALINVTNRPTLRAFEQAHEIAVFAGDADAAASLLGKATERWGVTAGFKLSPLAEHRIAKREGAAG